jgi:UDPglucose 6-dehydrogenase
MANLCERHAADINDVRRGIGHDSRIGFAFLFPGVGYGGSCFPKDVRALIDTFKQSHLDPRILQAVDQVNEQQKCVLQAKIKSHFAGKLAGRTLAVWGLAFKPRTDDIREAPAVVLINHMLELGATLRVHDPEAMDNIRQLYGDRLIYSTGPLEALDNADALAIVTEWSDFRNPDFRQMRDRMKSPVIFDGRNLYDPQVLAEAGFTYHSIGRSPVTPAT